MARKPLPFQSDRERSVVALDVCANIRVIQYANSNALNIVRIDSFTSFVAAGLSLTFSRLLSSVVARWSAFLSHSLTLGFSFYVGLSVCPPSFSHFALTPPPPPTRAAAVSHRRRTTTAAKAGPNGSCSPFLRRCHRVGHHAKLIFHPDGELNGREDTTATEATAKKERGRGGGREGGL